MKLKQLLQGVTVCATNADPEQEITGVCYDSRRAEPGNLFIAVPGYAVDGHRFIPQVQAKGVQAVVCERPPEQGQYIQVASSREAMARISANWFDHPARKMTMIGVTGTNGKTTVTTVLKQVLETTTGKKVGLIGTIQNEIGDRVIPTERTTPESYELQALLARMRQAGCDYVIMEVSSHAIALARVAQIHYQIGVFTNLTEDHLDFHKTMENYAETKARLFSVCDVGIINTDDAYAQTMMADAACRIVTTAVQREADYRARNIALAADHVEFDVNGSRISIGIPGGFTVYNGLSVVAAAAELGIPMERIRRALQTAKSVKGRVEVVPTPGTDYTVLIDYAHTPDALENVLRSARGFCKGRLIAVFGCGGDRDPIKRPLMGEACVKYADLVVITSDNPRTEESGAIIADILPGVTGTKTPYVVIENRVEAIHWVMDQAQKDDVIVLAGKGHETYQIIGTEKFHLDEREVVAARLRGK